MINNLNQLKKNFKTFYIGLLLLFSAIWMLPPFFALEKGIQGIDPSWKIATTLALEKRWVWGEDIIFTYGPLAFLSTRFLDNIPGFFLLLFDVFILGQLGVFLYRSLSTHFNIITGLYLILLLLGVDNYTNFDTGLLLIALTIYFYIQFLSSKQSWLLYIAMADALLCFLVKINTGIIALFTFPLFLCYSMMTSRITMKKGAILAGIYAFILILSLIVFKISFFKYIQGAMAFINGYPKAMLLRTEFDIFPLLSVLLLLLLLLLVTFFALLSQISVKRNKIINLLDTVFLFFSIAFLTFLSFKQGFVRSDETHILQFYRAVILIGGILYFSTFSFLKPHWSALFLAGTIVIGYPYLIQKNIKSYITLTYWEGKQKDITDYFIGILKEYPDQKGTISRIPESILREIGDKTVDIIPIEISVLYQNKLNYKPRPTLQSYASYNHYLDTLNYQKYMSDNGPEYVFFANTISIDAKYAFWDEPMTKLALLQNYELIYPKDSVFCESCYLNAYKDAADSVVEKKSANALDHYMRWGRYQGKYPNAFHFLTDTLVYSFHNPDVESAVKQGQIANAIDHYNIWGWRENRTVSVFPMLFKRRNNPRSLRFEEVKRIDTTLISWIEVPPSEEPLYLFTRMSLTDEEKKISNWHKPPIFMVQFRLSDGTQLSQYITEPVLENGVLINRLVRNEQDAYLFFKTNGRLNPSITSFRFIIWNHEIPGGQYADDRVYSLTIKKGILK